MKPRVVATLKLLRHFKADVMLDLSCGDGSITVEIAKVVKAKDVYGVDVNEKALHSASVNVIKVFKCDLSKDPIPLSSESVDLVTALEGIEHLINPDHMLKEVYRVLKKEGYFIISTVNLGNWLNRLIFLLGY